MFLDTTYGRAILKHFACHLPCHAFNRQVVEGITRVRWYILPGAVRQTARNKYVIHLVLTRIAQPYVSSETKIKKLGSKLGNDL